MKNIFFILSAVLTYNTAISQEKIYSTKSGSITFFSSTPLEKIEGINNQVTAKMSNKSGQLAFVLLVKGFKFDNALMQDHFNENYMESTKFAKADFKGTITNITTVNFAKDGNYPVNVEGNLTIHGVTKKITAPGTIEIKAEKAIAKSLFKIKIKDFGITGKYIGDKIANEVEATVVCKFD